MNTLLWILAAFLFISGVLAAVRGQFTWAVVLIILAFLVGPAGVSVFT